MSAWREAHIVIHNWRQVQLRGRDLQPGQVEHRQLASRRDAAKIARHFSAVDHSPTH